MHLYLKWSLRYVVLLYTLLAHTYVLLQFAGPNEMSMGAQVIAGTTNSVVIDKQRMYWMAGKVRWPEIGL